MVLLTHHDRAISERLQAELALIGERLGARLISDLSCVNSLISHVERYRGKMLRPTLVLVTGLAASANGQDQELTEAHRVIATVTEMVHLATLVHDDVLDDAQVRRHGATVNHLRGNETAVMLGDYLISHAYHLCSTLGDAEVSLTIGQTTNTICEGELLQLANRDNLSLDERTYFEIIRRKTASLCGTCCRLGAATSGVSVQISEELYSYGEKLGMAYQIVDDLLDLTGSESTVGKTVGRDLQKGKLTLPVIHFLRSASEEERQELQGLLRPTVETEAPTGAVFSDRDLDPSRMTRIQRLVGRHHSIDYAQDWANRLVEQAKATLDALVDSPAKTLLLDMADAVLSRKF